SGVPATVQEEKYNSNQTNIVLSMYDTDGNNIRSPQHSPIPSTKSISRQNSRPTSPNPNPPGLYPAHSNWNQNSGGKNTHLTPPNVGHYSEENGEVVGYHSDHNIPAWLRSLRLHKYTPVFEGMIWQDIIELDDASLEQKGVAALGARRKMLKEFDKVKVAMQQVEKGT
ncbi:32725_t:CDS:2, partial [Racocetra persica]